MANKVRFGLKNVYYAILTESDNAAPSYGTPKRLLGAVSLDLSQDGSTNSFYADNIEFFRTDADNGYTGSLELARISDEALKDIWGFGYDSTNKLIYEDSNASPKPFALLFQVEGDANADLYVLYKVYASRPNIGSTTIDENGKEPQTQTVDIAARPVPDPTNGVLNGKVYLRTDESTSTSIRNGWFSAVYTNITVSV